MDNLKKKVFDIIFIIMLYREELVDQSFYILMTILAFIWTIHQLTIKRSEYVYFIKLQFIIFILAISRKYYRTKHSHEIGFYVHIIALLRFLRS